MRLALLTNAAPPYRVPVFERIAREDGVTARVFLDGVPQQAAPSFPCEQLPPGLALRWRNYQDETRFAEQLVRRFGWSYLVRLAAFRPDVVISLEFGWRTLHAAGYAALAGIPLLVWWEGTPFTERHASALRRALRRGLAARADALLGFGRGSVACLEAIAPEGTAVHFVPQAVDNARIAREVDAWRGQREAQREALGLRGTVLLCVSRLLPHKGIPELLAALHRLRDRAPEGAFTALLAGDGPLRESARRAGDRLGGALHVLGAVPSSEITRYLAAADLLVFPTLRDCWGMVVNEALAAGLPVLGSRYAGACDELLAGEEVGRRFDPLDPDAFDDALAEAVIGGRWSRVDVQRVRRAVSAHTCQAAAEEILSAARGCLARGAVRSAA